MPSGSWKRWIFRVTAPTCWETQHADRPNGMPFDQLRVKGLSHNEGPADTPQRHTPQSRCRRKVERSSDTSFRSPSAHRTLDRRVDGAGTERGCLRPETCGDDDKPLWGNCSKGSAHAARPRRWPCPSTMHSRPSRRSTQPIASAAASDRSLHAPRVRPPLEAMTSAPRRVRAAGRAYRQKAAAVFFGWSLAS